MKNNAVVTIVSRNYMPFARVLGKSVIANNANVDFSSM